MDKTNTPTTPADGAAKPEVKEVKQETVGEALKDTRKADTSAPKTVPEAAFLELKKENKAATKRIKELEARIDNGDTTADVSDDVDALAEEFNIDKAFLNKLVKAAQKQASKDLDKKVDERVKPLESEKEAERIDNAFKKHYEATLAEMPEYADVVNRNVIKALSLDPANKDKTFKELIEEAYAPAIKGRKSLEPTAPRADKTASMTVDLARMKTDQAYYAEVMGDPDLKAQYNKGIEKRLRL